jgi:hypothetical protein
MMPRTMINRVSQVSGFLIPLAAFSLILVVVTTGWERNLADEGAAAHLFQLLLAMEIPVVALYVATARQRNSPALLATVALQAACVAAALGSLRFFGL